ncbi:hypothetical protein GCM10011490_18370 [Pseudoclavibacter endophyticus]|uniref:PucR family transcriptional regulator n=1 Tax=Pseudoclavibacter endophyticus TaxID=1778590 RepID=A0A6H9WD45_9MICO|nr:helix-turn-helix domain-containing protein [Pseudoclavibacter endophyticus]KAB1648819.1 PucR family transcriptional regulator [Pseudoclavibacter endophyticus]GGA68198.1 hypothetical protein GCM10011490_18370 [Pseudoclavibacter endophyticus]
MSGSHSRESDGAARADDGGRDAWTIEAIQAVTRAAGRPGGIESVIVELARRLGAWVALIDATGRTRRQHPGGLPADAADALRDEVDAVLRRGARVATTVRAGGTPVSLQTLGDGRQLRGVLAIASDGLTPEQRMVAATVAAMASLALARRHRLGQAGARLRAAVAELLTTPDAELTHRAARELQESLPPAPVAVATARVGTRSPHPATDWLDERADDAPQAVFFARLGEELVVLTDAAEAGALDELAEAFGLTVGAAEADRYRDLGRALDRARRARDDASVSGLTGVVRDGAPHLGARTDTADVLTALDGERALVLARRQLAPLVEHDEARATRLVPTLRAWLDADCSNDGTARALGVHRHTVRARLDLAQRLLGRDLGSFATRAELWAALRALP